MGDAQTSLVYNPSTGELSVDPAVGKNLTSINIESAGSKFIGPYTPKPPVLSGSFDNFAANNIFKATFGSNFGAVSFGNVLPTGLNLATLVGDMTVVGSLDGGGPLGAVDMYVIPEPSTMILLGLAMIGLLVARRSR